MMSMLQQRSMLAGVLFCAVAGAAGAATSEPLLRPGLWEMASTISSSDPQVRAGLSEMQKHLAGMSPEQRQAIQQMMQKNGMQLDLGSDGAVRTRMCMTREMIARKEVPLQQGDCTQKATQLSPTHVKVAFHCTKPAASGEGDVTITDDRHYHAHVRVDAEQARNTEADVNAAWIAADCGNLKPIPIPPAK